jgi:hypothetical protein
MSTENSGLIQQALDVIVGNAELRKILSEDGIDISNRQILDEQETIKDYVDICSYSEEDATNAYNNLKDYE